MRGRVLASLVLSLCSVSSFYLPGLAPVTYCDNPDIKTCSNDIKLFVNRLNSEESVIPYEYHQYVDISLQGRYSVSHFLFQF